MGSSFQGALNAAMAQAGKELSVEMMTWAKYNHPWTNQSGDLERSITPVEEKNGDIITFGIGVTVDYAPYVEAMPDKGVMQIALEHITPLSKRRIAEVSSATIAEWFRAGHG